MKRLKYSPPKGGAQGESKIPSVSSWDFYKEVEYYKKNGIPYQTLHDGEVIIMDTETK